MKYKDNAIVYIILIMLILLYPYIRHNWLTTSNDSQQEENNSSNYQHSRIIIENTKEVLDGKFLYEGKIYIPELAADNMTDKPIYFKNERFFLQDEMIELHPFQCVQEDTGEKVICYFFFTENISPEIKAVGKLPEKADQ